MMNIKKLAAAMTKEAELYANNDRLVELRRAEPEGENIIKITVTVTEHVGSGNQKSYDETARFEIVEESNKYRTWLRLDEIDDAEINIYQWAENFNKLQKAH